MTRKIEIDPIVEALESMPYGLYIIGSHGSDNINGMMADWVMQVSFNPRLVAVSLERNSTTLRNLRETGFFTVNMLGAEQRATRGEVLPAARGLEDPGPLRTRQRLGLRQARRCALPDGRRSPTARSSTKASPTSNARSHAAGRRRRPHARPRPRPGRRRPARRRAPHPAHPRLVLRRLTRVPNVAATVQVATCVTVEPPRRAPTARALPICPRCYAYGCRRDDS